MKATVRHIADHQLLGKTESNHLVPMDSAAASGGEGSAPTPVELLLQACAGCAMIDVVNIIRKRRKQLQHLEITVQASRATQAPKILRSLHYACIAEGPDLTDEDVRMAITLSLTKYCSVSLSLDRSVPFTVETTVNGQTAETFEIAR